MKIVILRGGGSLRRRRHSPGSAGSTRERGVMAIGNGSGRWVLVNMSPGVAHQLDSDLRLAFTAEVRKHFAEHPDHFDPRQYLSDARDGIRSMVQHKIVNVLGCNGKA